MRPSVRYSANDVPKAVLAWASVPVAWTYLLLAGPVLSTVKPWPVSHFATVPASDFVGENCARNWAGVRNLPYWALPGVETA